MPDLRGENLEEIGRLFFSRERPINPVAEQYSREELCAFVRELSAEMENAVKDLAPEQLAYRLPGSPGGWDASGDEEHFDTSEIVTHVAMGTAFYWWGITRSLGHSRPPFTRPPKGAKVTGIQGRVVGRGGWSGLSAPELTQMLRDSTEGFLAYVEGLPEEAAKAVSSYEGFGELTVKGWLLLLAVHFHMHLKQMQYMQAQPDYPSG